MGRARREFGRAYLLVLLRKVVPTTTEGTLVRTADAWPAPVRRVRSAAVSVRRCVPVSQRDADLFIPFPKSASPLEPIRFPAVMPLHLPAAVTGPG